MSATQLHNNCKGCTPKSALQASPTRLEGLPGLVCLLLGTRWYLIGWLVEPKVWFSVTFTFALLCTYRTDMVGTQEGNEMV